MLASKSELDAYLRHLKSLQSAFNTIQAATGIDSIPELVSMIVKSEEQSYNQHRQVNLLNGEAEELEEELMTAKRTISHLLEMQASGKKQAGTIINNLKRELAEVRDTLKHKSSHLHRVRDALDDSFAAVLVSSTQSLADCFDGTEFQKGKSQHALSRVTQTTVLSHLAEVEASVTALQSWQMYVHSNLPSLVSASGLKKMSYKRFDLSPISIKSTIADTLMDEEDFDEAKTPLREDQIRARMRVLLDQRADTLSGTRSVADHRRSFRMPL